MVLTQRKHSIPGLTIGIEDINMKLLESYIEILTERLEISNFPNNLVLISEPKGPNEWTLSLFDIQIKKPVGYIFIYYDKEPDVYSVSGAYSQRGLGPFLYETAMTLVYPKGLTASRESATSDDAMNVWGKFIDRNDVKK